VAEAQPAPRGRPDRPTELGAPAEVGQSTARPH